MVTDTERLYIGTHSYITPTHIVLKDEFTRNFGGRSQKQRDNEKNLKDNNHNSILSKKATSNLRTSINWLIHSAKYKKVWNRKLNQGFWYKVNFITLTIPAQKGKSINSKEFQKLLNTWLTYARKYFYLHNYVWKVECHKSGNLHIHLTTDTFIHYKKLRDSWNRILQKNDLLNEYYLKKGHYNPNSTDVHSVTKINNLAGYICKYMSKNPELSKEFKGRIWGTSHSLSSKHKVSVFFDAGYDNEELRKLCNSNIKWKSIETKPDSMGKVGRVGTIYFPNLADWMQSIDGRIREAYNNRRWHIRNNTPTLPAEYLTISENYINPKKWLNKKQNQQLAQESISQIIPSTPVQYAEIKQLSLIM